VGPRDGLGAAAQRKMSLLCPCRESNPGRPAGSLSSYTDWATPAKCVGMMLMCDAALKILDSFVGRVAVYEKREQTVAWK
jgi:hypothetical protein